MKTCKGCQEALPEEAFRGTRSSCKSCGNAVRRLRRQTQAGRFQTYRRGAKVRGHKWELSFKAFTDQWQKPCLYCAAEIKTIGLDRVDNSMGYYEWNVVPCCQICNQAKGTLSFDAFWEWLERLQGKEKAPEGA